MSSPARDNNSFKSAFFRIPLKPMERKYSCIFFHLTSSIRYQVLYYCLYFKAYLLILQHFYSNFRPKTLRIIYYLQNGLEYLEKVVLTNRNKTYFRGNVQLSALSVSGMILFPINKNKKQIERYKKEDQYRRKLLSAAKMGDETAIEILYKENNIPFQNFLLLCNNHEQ